MSCCCKKNKIISVDNNFASLNTMTKFKSNIKLIKGNKNVKKKKHSPIKSKCPCKHSKHNKHNKHKESKKICKGCTRLNQALF